ncbi:MAG: hypothetical protein LPK45_07140 [Bacteroidota bacterium]|nr:hypothetical protein [Bacteroidota bacterium]MDX5430851.1 hypothetical protein [Bacteroidota bacterium]MDX5469595.1 hypothetical protein [Bacteroidota bacterium]
MVIYNPKDWFRLIFHFHKSDTFRRLIPVMLAVGVFTALVIYVEEEVLHLTGSNSTVIYQLLGFVISLLLVFRTNTAYDRWWEGRKQWGALVNASRNAALKIKHLNKVPEVNRIQSIRWIMLYARVLKHHLRDEKHPEMLSEGHQPNQVASDLYQELNQWYEAGYIDGDQLRMLDEELRELTDITGACERIRKTPIPYSYNIFIKKFIFAYVMAMPFVLMNVYGYGLVPLVMFTLYVLASLELIAEEIEDPFGEDSNDLPTDAIAETIGKNLEEIIRS